MYKGGTPKKKPLKYHYSLKDLTISSVRLPIRHIDGRYVQRCPMFRENHYTYTNQTLKCFVGGYAGNFVDIEILDHAFAIQELSCTYFQRRRLIILFLIKFTDFDETQSAFTEDDFTEI